MALIAVTGATGYIGGRLVPQLLLQGHRVRVLTRSAEKLRDVPWGDQVDVLWSSWSNLTTAALTTPNEPSSSPAVWRAGSIGWP